MLSTIARQTSSSLKRAAISIASPAPGSTRLFSTSQFKMQKVDRLVSAQWLYDNLSKVKVLDCSWYLPFMNRDVQKEFEDKHIPGAQFFDIDGIKDLQKSDLPHMLPPPEFFGRSMDSFGIRNDDHVVVYDSAGVGPACRVFWTFQALGHDSVSVLNGGLPGWTAKGHETDSGRASPKPTTGYKAHLVEPLIHEYDAVVKNIEQLKASGGKTGRQIVDARPNGRFTGKEPEFRPGLSSGHMPHSINVPFMQVTNGSELKSPEELRKVFEGAGVDLGHPTILSCGSGVTASVLYFALLNAGVDRKNLSVYDGSWTEYALNPKSEIIKD